MLSKPKVFTQLGLRMFILQDGGCFYISNFCDDVEDLLEDVVLGHVLGDGDVVGALLVLPRRLVHVEHLGEGSLMTSVR